MKTIRLIAAMAVSLGVAVAQNPEATVPYQMSGDAGSFTNDTNPWKTVPLGKRFTIEHVTYHCVTAPGNAVYNARIKTKTGGVEAVHRLILIPQGAALGFNWFAVSQPVKLYADSATTIGIGAQSTVAAPGGQCSVTLSGYLTTTHATPNIPLSFDSER